MVRTAVKREPVNTPGNGTKKRSNGAAAAATGPSNSSNNTNNSSCPLANHFKLSTNMCPSTDKEKEEMVRIPYASAVGCLMYAMVCTRSDIAHSVGVMSRFLSNPGKEHWATVKSILRYLRDTSKICLCFGEAEPVLVGYTDADLAGDADTFAGGAMSWQSKLQKCIALSSTEAECIATTKAYKELLWMKEFF